jgi:sigma-E factor negative regulatory protein RseC
MENPRGRVIAIEHVEPSPHALVEVDASFSCARCAEGKGCGAGLLGGNTGPRRIDALIGVGLNIREGDEVRLQLAPSRLLQASVIAYGLPLSGAVLGAAFAYFSGLGDLYAALTALVGIAAGLVAARARLRSQSRSCQFTPTVVERLSIERLPVGH